MTKLESLQDIKDTAMRLVELAIAYYQDGIEGANGVIAE
jgi:hypothetical protein